MEKIRLHLEYGEGKEVGEGKDKTISTWAEKLGHAQWLCQ